MTDQTVMSAKAAADRLGVDKSTVTRWIAAGKLKAEKMEGEFGAWMVDRADVEALRDELASAKTAAATA